MARKTRQIETRMIAEYLKERYANFPHVSKQVLGAVSDELQAQMGYQKALGFTRPSRYEVDGMVILPNYLLLIEAKVFQIIPGLAKLPLYKSLVPVTPELKQYLPREVLMELVVGWTNANLETMARSAGVTVQVYCPDWLKQAVDDNQKYWTRDYRIARAKKLEMREYMGVE